MKFYQACGVLKFPWDQVASGFWARYPNPYSSHVLTEDTVCREIRQDKLVTKRLLTKTNKMPKWGERIVPGPRFVCIVEESIVDPKEKTLTTYTRNVGYTKLMVLEEKCTYSVNSENQSWTQVDRQAWIKSSVFGLSRPIQAFAVDRFKKNAAKAMQGFEHVLQKMYIPEVPKQQTGNNSTLVVQDSKLNKEKLCSTAKQARERATELAKRKAEQVVASVGKTASS